jgi:Holliday junction resolvase
MNKSKAKGTKFESDIVKYLTAHGCYAERIALAGANDCGDVYAEKDKMKYVIECKAHKSYTPAQEREWREQIIDECMNYIQKTGRISSPLLIAKQYGKPIGRSLVHSIDIDTLGWIMQYLDDFIGTGYKRFGDTAVGEIAAAMNRKNDKTADRITSEILSAMFDGEGEE